MMPETTTSPFQTDSEAYLSEPSFHILDILVQLARRRGFILLSTLGITLVAAIIAFLLPNQYMAETVLLPPSGNSSLASTLIGQMGGGSSALASMAGTGLGIKNPGDMYAALFRTQTVEDAVIRRFSLMNRYKSKTMVATRKYFEGKATVTAGVKDGLLRIDVWDRDPKMAADIANGYVEEFRRLSANLALTEASQRRLFFQQQLSEAAENLAKAEDSMKRTQQTTGVLQIDSQARSLIEIAAMLRAQVAAKQVEIQGMRSFATDENPELVTARRQLEALQAQLDALGGNGKDSNPLVVPKGKAPEAAMEYIRSYRNMRYSETVYDLIAKQYEIAKLDEARQGAVIQVADKALPPDMKSSPHRLIIVLLFFVVGLILSSAYVLVDSAAVSLKQSNNRNYAKLQMIKQYVAGRG